MIALYSVQWYAVYLFVSTAYDPSQGFYIMLDGPLN